MVDKTVTTEVNATALAGGDEARSVSDENSTALTENRPAIRYASDEEVEQAAEKIFRWHDRLFAELAK